jgi:choline dehydrogenase-like flavoprotein
MQIRISPEVRDVVIVGSGAAGGMAAWNLTRQGMKVTVLDAGTRFKRSSYWSHVKPWERRDKLDKGQTPPPFRLDTREQPYETPKENPFDLVRVWGRGGKTNIWGRVSLRYGDLDLQGPARDGHEIPWPIRYADIAPYYDKVDQLIGVCGGGDDQDSLPGSRYHLPAPNPRAGEYEIAKAAAAVGIRVVPGRRAVLTKPHNGKAPCHYCGACGQGCDISAFFNSTDYLLDPAAETGRLEIIDNAVAARVTVDDKGMANGVQFFERESGTEHQIRARVVIMAASCVDSTRILLNSRSTRYPNGIANSNDVIGRYFCEQVRFHMYAFAPNLLGGKTQNDDGIGGEHIYMPRFNHRGGKRDYLRGYGAQFWNTGAHPGAFFGKTLPGFGEDLKKAIKQRYPALVAIHPYGEVLPQAYNRITVDSQQKDKYGLPVPKITFRIGENEQKMIREMYDTSEEIFTAMKAEIVPFERNKVDIAGAAIHEHGSVRMGADPKRAALNGFNQAHEVKNLFVVDGSSFTTATDKNPTLTILALAWRSTDYLLGEMKAGRL